MCWFGILRARRNTDIHISIIRVSATMCWFGILRVVNPGLKNNLTGSFSDDVLVWYIEGGNEYN